MTKILKRIPRKTALCRASTAALCVALLASACGGPDEGALADEETESAIEGGTTDNDNLFPAVVRIEMNFPNGSPNCSATAVSHYALLTAAHCVYDRSKGGHANYVTVIKATGRNASSEGATSTQIVVHNTFRRDYSGEYYSEALAENDMALVIFGAGTFDSILPTGMTDLSAAAKAVTMVGFTGTNTRSYRKMPSWKVSNARLISTGDISEPGDSGGPWIVNVNGTPRVVGITGGSGFSYFTSRGFFINGNRYEGLRRYLQNALDYCVTGYVDKEYGGRSWSFCARSTINARLGEFTEADKFTTTGAWKHSHWNDEFSSTAVGDKVRGKYYDDVCSGTVWWINLDRNLTDNVADGKAANDRISCVEVVLR